MREFLGFKRGINLGGWLSQCDHTKKTYETFLTEQDIQHIASWGLDHVRLPIDIEAVIDKEGSTNEEGFIFIDQCIEWCKKAGLNVMLELHKTTGSPVLQYEGEKYFFQNEVLWQHFFILWEEFAKRYGELSDSVAFGLLNEVVRLDVAEQWNKIIKQAIQNIREYAPDTRIVVGGVDCSSVTAIKYLNPPFDENIVYDFHCFEPIIFAQQAGNEGERMSLEYHMNYPEPLAFVEEESRKRLKAEQCKIFDISCLTQLNADFFDKIFFEAVALSQLRNVPLYCGAYGVINKAPVDGTLKWFQDIHRIFEKYHIGRAVWNYKGLQYGITDSHYDEIREELITYF